ncbi:MAG: hypothetical protein AAF927_06430 [Bacteroidota bacterium]
MEEAVQMIQDSLNLGVEWQRAFDRLIDTIEKQASPSKDKLLFGIENLVDYHNFRFSPEQLSVKYLESLIHHETFNRYELYWLSHGHASKLAYKTLIYLIDQKGKLLLSDTLAGNKYENGSVKVLDWNQNGKEEIQYKVNAITSSVPIISEHELIYEFDAKRHALHLMMEIELDSRNCAEDDGFLIKQSYQFLQAGIIQVQKDEFEIDCAHFAWRGDIDGMKKIKSTQYLLNWSKDKRQYLPNQAKD